MYGVLKYTVYPNVCAQSILSLQHKLKSEIILYLTYCSVTMPSMISNDIGGIQQIHIRKAFFK